MSPEDFSPVSSLESEQSQPDRSQSVERDPWVGHDEAARLLKQVTLTTAEEAVALAEQSAAALPENTWTHTLMAEAYGRAGYYDHCRESYEHALSLDPTNQTAQLVTHSYEQLHEGGKKLLTEGNFTEALRMYDLAIAVGGGPAQAPWSLFDKAVVFEQAGDLDSAVVIMRQVLQYLPQKPWVLFEMGKIFEARGERGEAFLWYQHALEQDPSNKQAQEGVERCKPVSPSPSADLDSPEDDVPPSPPEPPKPPAPPTPPDLPPNSVALRFNERGDRRIELEPKYLEADYNELNRALGVLRSAYAARQSARVEFKLHYKYYFPENYKDFPAAAALAIPIGLKEGGKATTITIDLFRRNRAILEEIDSISKRIEEDHTSSEKRREHEDWLRRSAAKSQNIWN